MTLLLLVIWECRPLIRFEDVSTGWDSARMWRIGVAAVACAARKPSVSGRVAHMQSSASGAPFQRYAMDIVGPFPRTDKGSAYILVIGDYFTKWVEAYPMKDM